MVTNSDSSLSIIVLDDDDDEPCDSGQVNEVDAAGAQLLPQGQSAENTSGQHPDCARTMGENIVVKKEVDVLSSAPSREAEDVDESPILSPQEVEDEAGPPLHSGDESFEVQVELEVTDSGGEDCTETLKEDDCQPSLLGQESTSELSQKTSHTSALSHIRGCGIKLERLKGNRPERNTLKTEGSSSEECLTVDLAPRDCVSLDETSPRGRKKLAPKN